MVDTAADVGPTLDPIRVMLVDDSSVIRGLLGRWLGAEAEIEIVATASNGKQALDIFPKFEPDVVILDIEMPAMDGLTVLPKLLEIDGDVKIVMASTLTRNNAAISLRALAMGAADYIPKPSSRHELHGTDGFRRELLEKVRALGFARRRRLGRPAPRPEGAAAGQARGGLLEADAQNQGPGPISLRRASAMPPLALAIGSSTGGPQALVTLFKTLRPKPALPIFITQHMPPTFTSILAENLGRNSNLPCREAAQGDRVEPGHVYVAPGDYHMTIAARNGAQIIELNQDEPEHFCRPSVNPMLRSLAQAYRGRILTVILTGMGSDGLEGCQAVVEAGGTVLAQDEASSVVWGMPGAVAKAGVCSKIASIDQMAGDVHGLLRGARP